MSLTDLFGTVYQRHIAKNEPFGFKYFLQGKNRFKKPIFASERTIINVFDSHTTAGQIKPTQPAS